MRLVNTGTSAIIRERLQKKLGKFNQIEPVVSFKNSKKTLAVWQTIKPDLASVDINKTNSNQAGSSREISREKKIHSLIHLNFYLSRYHRQMTIGIVHQPRLSHDCDVKMWNWPPEKC